MPKNIMGAWRAFSTQIQSAIGAPATVDTSLAFEGEPMAVETDKFYVNDDEITGELLPTEKRLLTWKFAGKHKGKAYPHLVGMFAAQAMGRDVCTKIGTTSAYKHVITIDKDVVELPARTLIENNGATQKIFKGVACTGWTLSSSRGEFVQFEADLIGRGEESIDATARPARVAESYMIYGDAKIMRGGTFDGTTVTGGSDFSAKVISLKLSFENGGSGVVVHGDPSGLVASIRRGQKYKVGLEAEIELEDDSHRQSLLTGEELCWHIPIVGGVADGANNYTIEAILPRVAYSEAKPGHDDGTLKISAKFAVLSHPVHGGVILNVINRHAVSYMAIAA